MLVDQAKQVKSDVETLQKARQNRDQKNQFRSQHDKLHGLVEDVRPLAEKMSVLREEGIDVEYQGKNLNQVLERIERVKAEFEDDASWIIQPENDLSDLEKWIRERHRDKIQRRIQSAWRDYYQDQVSDLSDDLLHVLKKFDDFRESVQTIQKISDQLQGWKGEPPQTKDSLETFQKLAETRQSTWEELRSDEMSEDVLNFLVEAGTEGATVDQLTDEVHTWLERNDLLDHVRIRLTK